MYITSSYVWHESSKLVNLKSLNLHSHVKLQLHDYAVMSLGRKDVATNTTTTTTTTTTRSSSSSSVTLDWDTRMKIAIGCARGIAFLHQHGFGGNKLVHGNIKSSNVVLSSNNEAKLSDYALAPLYGSSSPIVSRVMGYRAPEVQDARMVTQKADVYSFGVLLLEILTGKIPSHTSNEGGMDLPRWVQSVVREQWTAEVFDLELMRHQNIEEEMVQTLRIAMECVAPLPDKRPSIIEVVKMLEDVRPIEIYESHNQHTSSNTSNGSNGHT